VLLDEMIVLAKAGAALDLRLARMLAWVKRQDLAPIGYSSYTAFCRERVEWRISWLRQLIRLVESDLELVKAAVCRGGLQLTTAVRALRKIAPDEQELWLLAALRGEVFPELPRRPPSPKRVVLEGRAARRVHRSRDLARLVVGQPLSNAASKSRCWRRTCGRLRKRQILSPCRQCRRRRRRRM
jgi:hypothetical protein